MDSQSQSNSKLNLDLDGSKYNLNACIIFLLKYMAGFAGYNELGAARFHHSMRMMFERKRKLDSLRNACFKRHKASRPVSTIGPVVEGVDRGIRPCARSCRHPYLQMQPSQPGICRGPARAKCANCFDADAIPVWRNKECAGSHARSAGARLGGATERGVLGP